jgi:hypothetical protein
MARPFFTIGHSTRSVDEFVDLLSEAAVRLVVDVRTIPRSRTNHRQRLADEQNLVPNLAELPALPPVTTQIRPVPQQQQQLQPKRDEKE